MGEPASEWYRETYIPLSGVLGLKFPFWEEFWRQEVERGGGMAVTVRFDDGLNAWRVSRTLAPVNPPPIKP